VTPELRMQIEMHKLADPRTRDIPADQWQMAMEIGEELVGIENSISEELGRDLTLGEITQIVQTVVPALTVKKALEQEIGKPVVQQ
jgi:hypothetical protein